MTVRFPYDCVYTTDETGHEPAPCRKVRVSVKRVGDVYEVYPCGGAVP